MKSRLSTLFNRNLIKAVGITIILSLLLFSLILGYIWIMYANFNELINKQFTVARLSDDVVWLDEVLTMSARMSALTGDPAWEARYHSFEPQLDDIVKQLHELAPASYNLSIEQTDVSNVALVKMELRSFELVQQHDSKAAQDILFGPEYLKQKQIYADGIQDVLKRSRADADSHFQSFESNLLASGIAGLIILPVFIISWVVMFYQISGYLQAQRKAEDALRESAEKIRTVFEAVTDGIEIMDIQGRLTDVNDAVVRLHGLHTKAELTGTNSLDLVADNDRASAQQLIRDVLISDGKRTNEIQLKRQDGSIFDGEMNVAPLKDKAGTLIGSVASIRDISARKAAQREQIRLIKELEDALLFKDQFLATMSHELRTPMNAVLGYTGIIMQQGGVDEDTLTMLTRIRNNSNRLLNLINDILDISRINANRVELVSRPVDVRAMVNNWYNDFQATAEKNKLKFTLALDPNLPPVILGDEERLTQITANLLQNAFKFTEKGGIELRVELRGGQWAIMVIDTGPGIPDTWQHLIFDEFRQVDGTSRRKYGGAGLGLSIVRKLCLLMGGNVVLASKPGEGSIFTVFLPLNVPQLQPDAA